MTEFVSLTDGELKQAISIYRQVKNCTILRSGVVVQLDPLETYHRSYSDAQTFVEHLKEELYNAHSTQG